MKFRIWLSLRYEQLKRFSPAVYFALQCATFSVALYGILGWRDSVKGVVFVPLCALIVLLLGITASWVYYDLFKMRIPEQAARWNMEPQYVNILSPKEAWLYDRLVRGIEGDKKAIEEIKEAAEKGETPIWRFK